MDLLSAFTVRGILGPWRVWSPCACLGPVLYLQKWGFGVCKRVFGCESIFGGFLSENHSNWYFPDTLTMELLVLLALSAAAAASPAVVTKLDAYADDSIRIRVVSQPRCPFVSSRPAPFHQHVISMRPSTRLKVPMATTQGFHLC